MLDNAGITDPTTQLQINIVLTAWCFVIACLGTWLVNEAGRKAMCLISVVGMTIVLFPVGALTKLYGGSGSTSGIYGTVATVFLFQGSYAIGITPLTLLYPPEVLNFSVRSNGMAAWTVAVTCGGVFVWPLALEAIGWKAYIINASWNVIQFVFVAYFWIETKGLTLEQIDAKFEKINPYQLQGIEGVSLENDTTDNMKLYRAKSDDGLVKIEARVAGEDL
ncbi:hexose transporter protein [Penicillium longicatenatum]|uniref:hexose transporter protein n=1 Tax=Penicillium longicatenatum TaxID=1561947 RepID=UPI0025468AC5|nr:hexose transporter protein [Penicillium longicatenatum]KAJ5635899.1 hexose transporter protein [Penicillium longicatenatum]